MKKTVWIMAVCLLFVNAAGLAQQDDAKRDITVKVVDRKGKPVSNIIVQASSAETGGVTNHEGVYLTPGLQNGDSITMIFPRIGEVYIPVQEGVDAILLTLRSNRELAAVNTANNQIVDLGYGGVKKSQSTGPSTVIDVPTLLQETMANDLTSLLDGRVPGMQIRSDGSNYNVYLRGKNPLIVVDGIVLETDNNPFSQTADTTPFQTLMDRYPVQLIQTITIDMTGTAYGTRGANGVILVTTRRQ